MSRSTSPAVRRLLIGAFACLTPLAGCKTVGPDYKGPPGVAAVNRPDAKAPFVSAAGPAFSPEVAPDGWWRLYDDPRLDQLMQEAFAANTDLRVATANLERSQALVRQVKAARTPSVEANASVLYDQLSAQQYLILQGVLPTVGLYDAGVSISYELDLFGRLHRAVQAVAAEDEAVEAARDLTRITVAAQVASAYAQACGAGEELAAANHALALQQQSDAVIHRLIKVGRASTPDATRSAGQVAQAQASIPGLEGAQRNALFRLAVLTGRTPELFPKDLERCAVSPRVAQPIPVGDGEALLRRRPDVRESERLLASSTAAIGVATAELYPKVSLGVYAGSFGLLPDLLHNATNTYSIGPNVSWQVNQSVARAKIAAANATAQARLAQFDGVVLSALRETEASLNSYSHDLQREADIQRVRDRGAEAEAQAQRLYTAGRGDYLSLLDAQRTLAAADLAVAASHAQLAQDQVTIFLALGGGWEGEGPQAVTAGVDSPPAAKSGVPPMERRAG